jgi:site-specific DNA-cytosine methylase
MNVLSLFDGMSCGQIALNRAGIKYDNYFASEIDKPAIKVTMANYPNTIQLGSVTEVKAENLPKIDLLIGGSPCQGFSFAGKQLNFDDPRSSLFFEYVRLLRECNPKYFLLENVKMKKEFQDVITEHLGASPVKINSSLVSAQNRERLYWTNIPINTTPEDKGLTLKDIISDVAHHKITIKHPETVRRTKNYAQYDQTLKGHGSQDQRFFYFNGKSGCITKSRSSIPKVEYGDEIILLLPEEVEKLQTVPTGYTSIVKTQDRYAMLGNGWTVDVIAHILRGIKES